MYQWLEFVHWDDQGLVPVIAQDAATNEVLMFAWMNRDALQETAETGAAVYWSRSRKRLWYKGEESGHAQRVLEIRADCDNDVILLKIDVLYPVVSSVLAYLILQRVFAYPEQFLAILVSKFLFV